MNAARATTTIFTQSSPLTAALSLRRFPGVRIIPKTHRFLPLKSPLSSSGQDAWICHLGRASDSDVEGLIIGIRDANTQEVKNILRLAERASMWREVIYTNFLTPPVLRDSLAALGKLADVKVVAHGGYPQAERCLISIAHPDAVVNADDGIAAFSITGNFKSSSCSHGAFLGSVLGTGIKREKVGDVIVQGENGAQVIIVPELLHFVVSTLDKVGNVPVSCEQIPLEAIKYEPPRTKTFTTVEESLRVDAVASAGYRTSRSYLSQLVSKGDVRVNWNTITKNGTIVKTGDIISVDGKGRLKIGEIRSTKKGKYVIELTRYL
ncbi:putative RNA-binding protein YlmH [Drosera capensis]